MGLVMDRSTTINLITKTYSEDAIGQRIPTTESRTVFCSVESVTRAEFQAAGELGHKAEFVVTMFAPDYQGEDTCELSVFGSSAVYSIYRTYLKGNELIELYLEKKVGAQIEHEDS